VILPVHYWQNWTGLFDPAGATGMGLGVVDQVATITACTTACWVLLRRRHPAA
jgi:ABC-2 type transport system permease protein